MSDVRVWAIAGQIGSGKSTVARAIASRLSCSIASFGDYIRAIAKERGRGTSRTELQEISEQLLSELGLAGITKAVLKSVKWDGHEPLVVDGIRHPATVEALKNIVSPIPVIVVYLDVRAEVRKKRLAQRDNLLECEIADFDAHLTEREVTQVRILADLVVPADEAIERTLDLVFRASSASFEPNCELD